MKAEIAATNYCKEQTCPTCGSRKNCDKKCIGTCLPTMDIYETFISAFEAGEKARGIFINGELIATLASKNQWINQVPDILPKLPMAEKLLFVDKNGNVLTIGEDFMAAEKQESYPVSIYHLTRTTNAKMKGV